MSRFGRGSAGTHRARWSTEPSLYYNGSFNLGPPKIEELGNQHVEAIISPIIDDTSPLKMHYKGDVLF